MKNNIQKTQDQQINTNSKKKNTNCIRSNYLRNHIFFIYQSRLGNSYKEENTTFCLKISTILVTALVLRIDLLLKFTNYHNYLYVKSFLVRSFNIVFLCTIIDFDFPLPTWKLMVLYCVNTEYLHIGSSTYPLDVSLCILQTLNIYLCC